MGWFFGQVWALCLVAFLLGALVTWSAFVMPLRRGASRPGGVGHGWSPSGAWTPLRWGATSERPAATTPPVPLRPGPAVDPALAALDSWVDRRDRATRPATGTAAAGALDLMGVGRTPDAAPPSVGGAASGRGSGPAADAGASIPTQPGPPEVRPDPAPAPGPPLPRRGDTGGKRPPP